MTAQSTRSQRDHIAHALALEFYRGEFREKTGNQRWLSDYIAGIKVGSTLAANYAEEQAQDMAERFWNFWKKDADELRRSL